ncbi:MAG: hypothetical protein ACRYG4_01130 [Janthinobacterium lividum]
MILAGVLLALSTPASALENCGGKPSSAATANVASLDSLAWAPFGRPETGWRVYAPRIEAETGTSCAPTTTGFADRLAAWQVRHGLASTGQLDAATFAVMKTGWQQARPFVRLNARLNCPPPPASLEPVRPAEALVSRPMTLRPAALAAYRAMVADARRDPAIAAEPLAFLIFSGFRDPVSDAGRCMLEGNCNGVVRATCSAHRTGLAIDLWVGHAPGFSPDSSDDLNRGTMVLTPAYRWLLANAGRYGFVNYAFEPWHWEWTGEAI